MIQLIKLRVKIKIETDDDGYYAYCPELKGIHVGGNTFEEALSSVKEAAIVYFESLLKNGDPLPLCAQTYSVKEALGHCISSLLPSKNKPITRIEDLALQL